MTTVLRIDAACFEKVAWCVRHVQDEAEPAGDDILARLDRIEAALAPLEQQMSVGRSTSKNTI